MRKIALLAVVATVGVIVFAAVVQSAGAGGPMVVTVVEHVTTDKVIDVGKPGDSSGDLLTFANQVYDDTNTSRVGRDQGSCIRISPGRGLWQCSWTTWFNGGSITVEGPFYDDRNSTLAITGGTGVYSSATGSMNLRFRPDPTELDFVYTIG